MEKSLGETHPHTLSVLSNLGYIYQSQGRWDQAGELAEKVYSGRQKLLGQDHPDTIAALEDLRRIAWVEAADKHTAPERSK